MHMHTQKPEMLQLMLFDAFEENVVLVDYASYFFWVIWLDWTSGSTRIGGILTISVIIFIRSPCYGCYLPKSSLEFPSD